MGELGDAHALEGLHRARLVASGGGAHHAEVCAAGHEDEVDDLVVEDVGVCLGDVGELAGALRYAQVRDVLAVDLDRAVVARGKPEDAAEQRGLSHAVGAEDDGERGVGHLEADVVEDLVRAVGERETPDFDAHTRFPLVMSHIKKGAPTKAVRMPMGISAVVAMRAMSSTMSKNVPPSSMLAGSRRR